MDPKIWGPSAWDFIHTVALGYPSSPTLTDKNNYRDFYTNIGNILPCPVCQRHYNEFLSGRLLDIDEALESTESLFNWTVDAHNNVNENNRKPIWTYAKAVAKYHALYIKGKRGQSVENRQQTERQNRSRNGPNGPNGPNGDMVERNHNWCSDFFNELSSPSGLAFMLLTIILAYFMYAKTVKHNLRPAGNSSRTESVGRR
jgi:hypothetical protein